MVAQAGADFVAWARSKGEKKPRAKTIGNAAWDKARAQAKEFMASGKWEDATPRHYVAAYELMHELVYSVTPTELDSKMRLAAAGMAKAMLDRDFGGESAEMAEYLRWVWQREQEREKWRRANGQDGVRIGWRLMFNGKNLLTDFRVAKVRKR